MASALALTLAACGGGDRGNQPAPQGNAASEAPEPVAQAAAPAAAINTIDPAKAGTPAPGVKLELPGSGETTLQAVLAANPGKKVLVNLWATWCPPCLAEMPELDRLAGETADRLVVVPVSQDMEGWQAVDKFFTAGRFKVLKPVLDQPGSLGEAMGARGLPMSILYDEQGREIWRVAGVPEWGSPAVRRWFN